MKRIYPHLHHPELHPAYGWRPIKVTTRADLGHTIRFMSLRRLPQTKDGRLIQIREALDMYIDRLKLGDVLWMFCDVLNASNLDAFLEEVKRRGAYLFDIWGYVPGSYEQGVDWGEYQVPEEVHQLIMDKLGPHFIGYDNGEQDGRYIGAYTSQQCPAIQDVSFQRSRFYDYFELMADHLQHATTALCSLNYCHYFAREHNVFMLGAETAQALPNANLWYAYLRGAGKQYGLLYFGNASVYNRFSWKTYDMKSVTPYEGYSCGPGHGTSISLLRRLIYLEYLYNADMLGYESSLFNTRENMEKVRRREPLPHPRELAAQGDKPLDFSGDMVLTPLGEVQRGCMDLVEKRGLPGPLHTPVVLYIHHSCGFTMPRHLYTSQVFRSWGQMPYSKGDHQLHALFSLLYPGYEDSGFYADERGFMSPTPYGDCADVMTSDLLPASLHQYSLCLLAGDQALDSEQVDKLSDFVTKGGQLLAFAGQLDKAGPRVLEMMGLKELGPAERYEKVQVVFAGQAPGGAARFTEQSMHLHTARLQEETQVLASLADGSPALIQTRLGRGSITLSLTPFGLADTRNSQPFENLPNQSIPQQYPLLHHVRHLLDQALSAQQLLQVEGEGLGWCVNLRDQGLLTLTLFNNGWTDVPFQFSLACGRELKRTPVAIPDTDPGILGYYPPGIQLQPGAAKQEGILPAGQIAMWDIHFEAQDLAVLPPVKAEDLSGKLLVSLRPRDNLLRDLLMMPALRNYFRGIKLDAEWLQEQDLAHLARCGRHLKRHSLQVVVDFSSLMDHYPHMSLLYNIREKYEENMARMATNLDKARALGASHIILMAHRNAENHLSHEQALGMMADSLKRLAEMARKKGITPLIQNGTPARMAHSLEETGKAFSLPLAFNLSHALLSGDTPSPATLADVRALLLSKPLRDELGQLSDAHLPLLGEEFAQEMKQLLSGIDLTQMDFICLDAVYPDFEAMYLDRAAWLKLHP